MGRGCVGCVVVVLDLGSGVWCMVVDSFVGFVVFCGCGGGGFVVV